MIEVTTQEPAMTDTAVQPTLIKDGIAFTVRVDCVNRDCLISNAALAKLSQLRSGASDPMEVYRAFEATINGVARRMVAANVPGTPLQLGPDSFH
jgi:hypothetical protein